MTPVVWTPSPKFGCMVQGTRGRAGQKVLGWVYHRIVGTLASADAVFSPSGPRMASSHFGIGHINGKLVIHQYVDLSDTAWANGDAREPSWSVVKAKPGINPNLFTISTEHEDGGTAGRGIVQPDVWAASTALSVLCTSGDINLIRAAGVHVRDAATVAQLAALPKTTEGFVDHHQIAGPNKPYCFRPWLDDPGFVNGSPTRRDQLLNTLNGTDEEEYPMLRRKFEPWTIAAGAKVYQSPNTSSAVIATLAGGPGATTHETGELVDGVWKSGAWRQLELGDRKAGWVQRTDLTPLVLGGVPAYDALVESVLMESDIDLSTGKVTPPTGVGGSDGATPDEVIAAVKRATEPLSEVITVKNTALDSVITAAQKGRAA